MLIELSLASDWQRGRYYAVILTFYRRKDYTDKKHPEGIVTPENIKKEGEQLGERLSQLENPWMNKAFGFFHKSYEVRADADDAPHPKRSAAV